MHAGARTCSNGASARSGPMPPCTMRSAPRAGAARTVTAACRAACRCSGCAARWSRTDRRARGSGIGVVHPVGGGVLASALHGSFRPSEACHDASASVRRPARAIGVFTGPRATFRRFAVMTRADPSRYADRDRCFATWVSLRSRVPGSASPASRAARPSGTVHPVHTPEADIHTDAGSSATWSPSSIPTSPGRSGWYPTAGTTSSTGSATPWSCGCHGGRSRRT